MNSTSSSQKSSNCMGNLLDLVRGIVSFVRESFRDFGRHAIEILIPSEVRDMCVVMYH